MCLLSEFSRKKVSSSGQTSLAFDLHSCGVLHSSVWKKSVGHIIIVQYVVRSKISSSWQTYSLAFWTPQLWVYICTALLKSAWKRSVHGRVRLVGRKAKHLPEKFLNKTMLPLIHLEEIADPAVHCGGTVNCWKQLLSACSRKNCHLQPHKQG